ncbi:hypothetical protein K437DRAFT_271591 [Tilletiaria anomala UBC 951]|uniref:Uncharacterized protein n=1 Tax=Tilletiaria anomala (strain ATCC 24038 / CBS 436.72 / UBC 951) TaxID=1037660 RepID=A0A066WQV1_TILAU|nr:uncharacterized protein K437DRAFT_271591 [Tilletiaria anomala UBC 951]KDN53359.1 hypothetical protein K437DRAFT_271591 [Tilletiaria anomala UBC 951]
MSQRDRLFQSLNLARQQVLDGVEEFRDGVTQRFDGPLGSRLQPQSRASGPPSSTAHGQGASDLQRNNTLPLYSSRNTGPPVPAQALHAPPGQSQREVDVMRASSRRAGGRSETGAAGVDGLKTVHTYSGAGGRAILELHTAPQQTPTYMGGSVERGRGAMVGRLCFTPKPQEKISHITLKLKAVVRVRVPVVNPNAPGPAQIAARSPVVEQTMEREVLLLQLEQSLYQARPDNKEKYFEMPASAAHDSTVTWPFQFDIPVEDRGGRAFPVSYVLMGDEAARPQPKGYEPRGASLISVGRGLLSSLKNVGQSAADANEWASVKWYLKATIGRPGMLETNDRIFAPFTYLPPPPRNMFELLDRRARTPAQLRENTPFEQLMESSRTWQAIDIGTDGAEKARPGLLGSLFGVSGRAKQMSDWTLEMPSSPAVFTLQGSIPFYICSKAPRELGAPLIISLFKRITLVSRSTQGSDVRKVCGARIATSPTVLKSQRSGVVTYRWKGVLDIPPTCGPCFDSQILSLEYFIGIQERLDTPCIYAKPIVLMCAPPRLICTSAPSPATGTLAQLAVSSGSGLGTGSEKARPTAAPQAPPHWPDAATASSSAAPTPPPPPHSAPDSETNTASSATSQAPLPLSDEAGLFDELNVEGMQVDLPPSYFEATGFRDAD